MTCILLIWTIFASFSLSVLSNIRYFIHIRWGWLTLMTCPECSRPGYWVCPGFDAPSFGCIFSQNENMPPLGHGLSFCRSSVSHIVRALTLVCLAFFDQTYFYQKLVAMHMRLPKSDFLKVSQSAICHFQGYMYIL